MGKSKLDSWNIADRIHQLMTDRDIPIADFAKRTGLGIKSLKNILSGVNNPQLKTAIKIADTFGVTLDWLCTEVKERQTEV